MNFIKYIDSFGIKFHFYTNNQPNHQNIFGGIMTFIYIIICIIIFIFFSYEDLFRLNPISSMSEINDIKPRNINIKNEKIWLPFRIVSNENKYIDHRGILFIFPYLVEGINNDNSGMKLKYRLLNYKLCNETSMANKPNNYKIDVPLNQLFCIENDDFQFGGNWNGNFISYIEINLYLCKDNIYFNSSNPKCENLNNLLNELNSSLSFDFYYPVVQFQPTNFETPIEIIYKNYFYRLGAFTHKLQKIYIREHLLSDDKNLLKNSIQNITCWGTSSLYGDSLVEKYDPIIKNKSFQSFKMEIYMDYGLIYYTRTYKKLFLIISDVFPLFRLVLYFLKKFTQHIKKSHTKRKLVQLIFENKNVSKISLIKIEGLNKSPIHKIKYKQKLDESNGDLLKNHNFKNSRIENNKLNIHQNEEKNINLSNKNNGIQINKEKNSENNKFKLSLIEEKNNKELNKNENELINIKKIDSSEINGSLKIKNHSINENKINSAKRKNYIFPYYYFFLDFFLDKIIIPEKFFCISKKYFTVYNFMCQIYDISTHIILFKQFNLLNNTLKNIYIENGFCPAHPFKKININDNELIDKLNKDLKNKKSILFSKHLL